jgi:hypothetical protein
VTRIGFSTGKGNPVSAIIRFFTGSRASHAWLLVHDPLFDMELVMEAHEVGFRLVPFKTFRKANRIVAIVDPQHPLDPGVREAAKWLGSQYDFRGLFGMMFVIAGRVFRRKWKNPFRSARSMFCSEAVVRVLRASGFPDATRLSAEDTTPQDLMDFFVKEKRGIAVPASSIT